MVFRARWRFFYPNIHHRKRLSRARLPAHSRSYSRSAVEAFPHNRPRHFQLINHTSIKHHRQSTNFRHHFSPKLYPPSSSLTMASIKPLSDESNEMSASAAKIVTTTTEALKNHAALAEEAGEILKSAIAKMDRSLKAALEAGKKTASEANEVFRKEIESIVKAESSGDEVCNEGETPATAEQEGKLNPESGDKDAVMKTATMPPAGEKGGDNSIESGGESPKSPASGKPKTRSNRLALSRGIAKVRTVRSKKVNADVS